MKNLDISIEAKPLLPIRSLPLADRHVAGNWPVELAEETPRDRLAEAALEVFHATVAVEQPENFEFFVVVDELEWAQE